MFGKEELKERFKHEIPFDVENWYPLLKQYSFDTQFIPLTIEEAICILQRYRKDVVGRTNLFLLDEQQEELGLQKLTQKLQDPLNNMKEAFIRLSTRSPKDAVMNLDENKEILQDRITTFIKSKPNIQKKLLKVPSISEESKDEFNSSDLLQVLSNEDYNDIIKIIFNTTKQFLKVGDSSRALKLLCSSERVYTDLKRLLIVENIELFDEKQKIPSPEQMNQQISSISCRKWQEDMDDECEFRCFFFDKKLTAISQYNYYFLEETLQKQGTLEIIKKEIQNKFNQIQNELPMSSGVVDFAVFYKKSPCQSILIELNPFNDYKGAGTGGSLFCWHKDIEVLEGKKPLEIRVVKEIRDNLLETFLPYFEGDTRTIIAKSILNAKQQSIMSKCMIM